MASQTAGLQITGPNDRPERFSRGKRKRKRKRKSEPGQDATSGLSCHGRLVKRLRKGADRNLQSPDVVKHALLAQYYPYILTLRQYVLHSLPASSKIRRKRISAVGKADQALAENVFAGVQKSNEDPENVCTSLSRLLDTTLIGTHNYPTASGGAQSDGRLQQWISYSQKGEDSDVSPSDGVSSPGHCQTEIVDFIIWLLFSREAIPNVRPQHLLCDGFRKNSGLRQQASRCSVQGLYSVYPNERVMALKRSPWPQLLSLLGQSGEGMMIHMLLDCAIFLPIEVGQSSYYQLSGSPIFEAEPMMPQDTAHSMARAGEKINFERKPTDILFVRSRMLYARATLSARGSVHFGLRHIHALNRFPNPHPSEDSPSLGGNNGNGKKRTGTDNTVRMMMYIFPRQFGLHNVFTSHVDPTRTAQKFQDYTLREEEITTKFLRKGCIDVLDVHIPKRLRGRLEHLVRRLQTLHARCSYVELLHHYCPAHRQTSAGHASRLRGSARTAPSASKHGGNAPKDRNKFPSATFSNEPSRHSSLTELASPISGVSAFCQAVLLKIIPHEFWGQGDVQDHNRRKLLHAVDRFVRLRRFETLSLHEVMQGLKVSQIDWLQSRGLIKGKSSLTDSRKQNEILYEFIYYIFDSILIPLVRSNFYVTESNIHRNRVFFFRHDIWRSIAEPAMAKLKVKLFEEVKLDEAQRILGSRRLGYSQIRLLPKQASVRPITNLRRRMLISKDQKVLGQSINATMGPVYNMLRLETMSHASRLGSAMFSVGEIYKRIDGFKLRLGYNSAPLYFVKLDVQAAFDTIPQAAIISMMRSVPSQREYQMVKHVEIRPHENGILGNSKVMKRWYTSARAKSDNSTFLQMIARREIPSKKNAVYVDSVFRKSHSTQDLLALTESHILQNLIKIGKKYYRQKKGIPQGSVISSTLCNYFYGDLEDKELQFLKQEDCLLLRLIDDFLLITTDKNKASGFVTVMQKGMPEYGITISPDKTLVNFDMSLHGTPVPKIQEDCHTFPYCGIQINCHTLDVTRDRGLSSGAIVKDLAVSDSLTVEFSRHPGRNFGRKLVNSFKLQANMMFYDTRHNSLATVHRNLHEAFTESAVKAWAYLRCLPSERQPSPRLIIESISNLLDVAHSLLTSPKRKQKHPGYECKLPKAQVRDIGLQAFRQVMGRKQARLREVLGWLDEQMVRLGGV